MQAIDELNMLLGIGPPKAKLPMTLEKSGYQPVRQIGKGGFGQAHLVFHKIRQQYFVAKHINLAGMTTKQRKEAHNEITMLQRLDHPNIVRYVEYVEEGPHLYIVMEYADGGDLFSHLKKIGGTGKRLSEEQVMALFTQTSMAIKHMHDRRMLHRDIKAQNVFLTKSHVVKLGDFGISTVLNSTMAMAQTMCGTPCYFSPELCAGKPYNNKSDIWALGVLLYEMCTCGELPFEAQNVKSLMDQITKKTPKRIPEQYSDQLAALVAAMMNKDPKQRPDINGVLRSPAVQKSTPSLMEKLAQLANPEALKLLSGDNNNHHADAAHAPPPQRKSTVSPDPPRPPPRVAKQQVVKGHHDDHRDVLLAEPPAIPPPVRYVSPPPASSAKPSPDDARKKSPSPQPSPGVAGKPAPAVAPSAAGRPPAGAANHNNKVNEEPHGVAPHHHFADTNKAEDANYRPALLQVAARKAAEEDDDNPNCEANFKPQHKYVDDLSQVIQNLATMREELREELDDEVGPPVVQASISRSPKGASVMTANEVPEDESAQASMRSVEFDDPMGARVDLEEAAKISSPMVKKHPSSAKPSFSQNQPQRSPRDPRVTAGAVGTNAPAPGMRLTAKQKAVVREFVAKTDAPSAQQQKAAAAVATRSPPHAGKAQPGPAERLSPARDDQDEEDTCIGGHCLCGSTVYAAWLSDAVGTFTCDCMACRRFSGSITGTDWIHFPECVFSDLLQPSPDAKTFVVSQNAIELYFCGACGSSIAMLHEGIDGCIVARATLSEASAEIFSEAVSAPPAA
jgi:serine/threonine protein kinase